MRSPQLALFSLAVLLAPVTSCGGGDSTGPTAPVTWNGLAAGYRITCGLATGGAVYCWGFTDITGPHARPTALSGGLLFQTVSAGADHVCALTPGGAAYCGGLNGSGQLGDGTTNDRTGPVAVSGGLLFQAIGSGGWHTCGLTAAGAAHCWGDNAWGAVGDGNTGVSMFDPVTSPVAVTGGLVFRAITGGDSHTCGLTTDGAAYCWGANLFGQLGGGTQEGSRSTPVAVAGGLVFQTISAGYQHTCGVTTGGVAYCWGLNDLGQLGDGTSGTMDAHSSPVLVAGGLTFQAISAGGNYTCGLTTTGAAYCWGDNGTGQLGNGSLSARTSPAAVSGSLGFQSISCGYEHACGLTTGGSAYCWGLNDEGQLGNGTLNSSSTPVAVIGF